MLASPLSPGAITQSMVDALPVHTPGDTTSDLCSSYEAIALFCHACVVNLGFRLVGFTQDDNIQSECQSLAPRLPARWNTSFGYHSFFYAHSQSSMKYVLKVDRMGGKAEIRALGVGDNKIHRFEVTVRDFISSNALPVRIPFSRASGDNQAAEDRSVWGGLHGKLRNVFISEARMKDLADLVKLKIVAHIMPGLKKEGYEEGGPTEDDMQALEDIRQPMPRPRDPVRMPEPARPNPYPSADPLVHPRGSVPVPSDEFPPPGWDDPLDMHRPRLQGRNQPGLRSPLSIGHDDLNPPGLGAHDPLRGSFVPGGGLPRPGHGGMHPTFEDPLFSGPGRASSGDSNPQAPDGARWDPVGPGFPISGGRRGRDGRGGSTWGNEWF